MRSKSTAPAWCVPVFLLQQLGARSDGLGSKCYIVCPDQHHQHDFLRCGFFMIIFLGSNSTVFKVHVSIFFAHRESTSHVDVEVTLNQRLLFNRYTCDTTFVRDRALLCCCAVVRVQRLGQNSRFAQWPR